MSPMLVSSIFLIVVVVLCFAKPNVGRIFLGLFFLGMAPLDRLQLPWLGLIIGEVFLFKFDFDRSFIEMILRKPAKEVSNA